MLDQAADTAEKVLFDCPDSQGVHKYLARMNFYSGLPANVSLSRHIGKVKRRDRRESLIELTRVRSADEVMPVVDRVMRVAQRDFGSRQILRAFCVAVSELLENAVEHACSPIGGLVAAQRYETSRLELMVVDLGRGIKDSLAQNPSYAELTELGAIRRALEDGVSSLDDPGRGGGLPNLVSSAGTVPRASVRISSGEGEVDMRWVGGDPVRLERKREQAATGTWIYVRLENFSHEQ